MFRSIRRRDFLKITSLAATALAMPTISLAENKPGQGDVPNILFIAIDDLNDWVGCLGGHPQAKTPNLDRLAARGVNFTNAFCAAPACNPSRAALMTGVAPYQSGVYTNPQPFRPVMPDAVTLPMYLMKHGYSAFGGGKIYHGGFPDPQSWEYYCNQGKNTKDPEKVMRAGGIIWGSIDGDDDVMDDYRIVNWAAGELEKEHEKPFFLAAGIFRPHMPWTAPKKYYDMHPLDKIILPNVKADDLDDVPQAGHKMAKPDGDHKNVTEKNLWKEAVQAYLACGSFADAMVGRLLDALDKSAYAENTIICLWSDHGWHLGEKLHWRKFSLWEEATHNVMMITAPGVTKPNSRCARPVSLIDIYPTLVELVGLPPKDGLAGESVVPLLKNPEAKRTRPAITTHGRKNHTIRTERWRYIQYADGSEELYDHNTDQMEWTNLANNKKFESVKKELAAWLPKTDAPDAPINKPVAAKNAKKTGK